MGEEKYTSCKRQYREMFKYGSNHRLKQLILIVYNLTFSFKILVSTLCACGQAREEQGPMRLFTTVYCEGERHRHFSSITYPKGFMVGIVAVAKNFYKAVFILRGFHPGVSLSEHSCGDVLFDFTFVVTSTL